MFRPSPLPGVEDVRTGKETRAGSVAEDMVLAGQWSDPIEESPGVEQSLRVELLLDPPHQPGFAGSGARPAPHGEGFFPGNGAARQDEVACSLLLSQAGLAGQLFQHGGCRLL